MKSLIYLDNAATTRPFLEVLEAMLPFYGLKYGNPSAGYQLGEESKKAIEHARNTVATTMRVEPETIYFTSGGTESDNWAIHYAVERAKQMGISKPHIITSAIEHHAILKTCEQLETQGVRVSYIPVDFDGVVNVRKLEQEITKSTVLISVMYANNEIGTIQPVPQIARIAKRHGVLFHVDAVQAYGQIPIYPEYFGIDLMSASAHKFNGPKGVGFLYAGKDLDLKSWIHGGAQEKQMRAGTENVPGIVGLGKAAGISYEKMKEKITEEIRLRNYCMSRLIREINGVKINGSVERRLPNNINICIDGVNGGAIVALMDLEGICISAASACSTGSDEPSHVQIAIGNSKEQAYSAIRITLGMRTTKEEIDATVDALKKMVEKLRSM